MTENLSQGAATNLIDVWDVSTFDRELRRGLDDHASLIRDYIMTDRRLFLEREASDRRLPAPENPFAVDFYRMTERVVMKIMASRTIRGWHYTRMTDDEVVSLRASGIYLSSLETIRSRLAAQVLAGAFSQDAADQLFADSPFSRGQEESRSSKFWMVSHPLTCDDGGVELLLGHWGGEATYFWQQDPKLQATLRQLGKPRVLEVAAPMAYSNHAYCAARATVAAYARRMNCPTEEMAFDFYVVEPLGPQHILDVHTENEPSYMSLGRGYPIFSPGDQLDK
jgi:hypothetical protein